MVLMPGQIMLLLLLLLFFWGGRGGCCILYLGGMQGKVRIVSIVTLVVWCNLSGVDAWCICMVACVCVFVCVCVCLCVCVLCLQRNLHFLIDATLSGNLHFMTSPWKARPAHVCCACMHGICVGTGHIWL